MSSIIIDSSVGMKWFIPEEKSEKATELFDREELFCIPALFFLEIDAVLTRNVRIGVLETEEITEIHKFLNGISFQVVEYSLIQTLAIEVATSLPVALYDAVYIATAIHQEGSFITADKRLYRGLSNTHLEEVITLL